MLDPLHSIASTFKARVRDAATPTAHNPMLDQSGRVWYTARIRAADNPSYCKKGSNLLYAKSFPIDASQRQLAVYEPKSGKYTFVDTCFSTHHLQFAEDANNTLWTSGGHEVV